MPLSSTLLTDLIEQIKTDLIDEIKKAVRDEIASGITPGDNRQSNDKPITTKELCTYLGISEPTIIRWRKNKKIPFMQMGSNIRYKLNDVIKALEKNGTKKI